MVVNRAGPYYNGLRPAWQCRVEPLFECLGENNSLFVHPCAVTKFIFELLTTINIFENLVMAAVVRARDSTKMVARYVRLLSTTVPPLSGGVAPTGQRYSSTKAGKPPRRLVEVQRLLYQAEERYNPSGHGVEPIPDVTLGKYSSVVLFTCRVSE